MALRPTKLPLWAAVNEIDPVTGNANKVEPPLQWKNSGVKYRQPVPRQYLNYNQDLICDWIEYLDEQVSAPTPIPNILDAVYPVGSVYYSTVTANPSTYGFPGTWVAFGQGRFFAGYNPGNSDFNAVKKTGGAPSHTHTTSFSGSHDHGGATGNTTLTINQIPSHTHQQQGSQDAGPDYGYVMDYNNQVTDRAVPVDTLPAGGGDPHNHTITTDGYHNHTTVVASNLPPYVTLVAWERVS